MHPDKTKLINTLFCKPVNFVPLAELGIHPAIKEAYLQRPMRTLSDEIDFWVKAGYDYIKLQPAVSYSVGYGKIENSNDRSAARNWAPESAGLITSVADFEKFTFPLPADINYSIFENIKSILPDGLGIIGQYGDIFTLTWELMGFEQFAFALYEDLDLVLAINNAIGNTILSMFTYLCQHEQVDAVWYSDDIAYNNGLMVSPDVLELLCFSWIRKIGALAKEYHKPFIYHTDGDISSIIPTLIDCGVHALHPIEPAVLSLTGIKQLYKDKLCLIGNFDVDLLARGNPQTIRKAVLNTLEQMHGMRGYCAGSGNSIPEYVPLPNYLAMTTAVKDWNNELRS